MGIGGRDKRWRTKEMHNTDTREGKQWNNGTVEGKYSGREGRERRRRIEEKKRRGAEEEE
jgi:hypothetical protein